jgi:hypothetical protein
VQRLENDTPAKQLILELGAGTGTSALEASRFCKHAVLTDGNPHAVSEMKKTVGTLASSSAALQQLQAAAGDGMVVSNDEFAHVSIEVMELMWGDAEHIASLQRKHPEGFDLIVAGDVIYGSWKSHLEQILLTVDSVMGHRSECCFILAGCIKRVDGDVGAVVKYITDTAERDFDLVVTKHDDGEIIESEAAGASTGFSAGKDANATNVMVGGVPPRPWEKGQRSWRDPQTWRGDYQALAGVILLFKRKLAHAPAAGTGTRTSE